MDELPGMKTDAGRAVMKTPATLAASFVLSGAVDASGNHTLFFQACRQSLGNEVLEVTCMLWTLGHSPSHISSGPGQAPTRIRTRAYSWHPASYILSFIFSLCDSLVARVWYHLASRSHHPCRLVGSPSK